MRLIKNIIKSFDDFKILKEKLQTVNQNNGLINSIRIYLTESCNANCNHCFNKGIREDRHMIQLRLKCYLITLQAMALKI